MTSLKQALAASAAVLMVQQVQSPRLAWSAVEGVQHNMGNYSTPLLVTAVNSGPLKTAGAVWCGATARRIQIYETEFGQTGILSTTDCQCQWDMSRFASTAAMTGTTTPANLLDPADVTCNALCMYAQTAEPTYTASGLGFSLKSWAINQRGSYRWRALDDGDNILIPASTGVGIGMRTLSSSFTNSAIGSISFIER